MTTKKTLKFAFVNKIHFSYNQELWKSKVYNLTNLNKEEQNQIVPQNSKTLDFQILRVLTKVGYHYKISGNPDRPIEYFVQEDIMYLKRNIKYKKNALLAIYEWEESRTGHEVVKNQLTGFQRFIGIGKLNINHKKNVGSFFWTKLKLYGRTYLFVPGYYGKKVGKHQEYIWVSEDANIKDASIIYDPKKYIIVSKFF